MKEYEKRFASGRLVKLLHHKRDERGMTLIEETSRCIRCTDIHELVTTNQRNLSRGDRVDRVGFLGFVEFHESGVIESGDPVSVNGGVVGVVVGFDASHFPNHYNILIEVTELVTATDLNLHVGQKITFGASTDAHLDTVDTPPTLIFGYGRAGRFLHLPCVKRARRVVFGNSCAENIFVVDPAIAGKKNGNEGLTKHTVLQNLSDFTPQYPDRTIAHICTPPAVRSELILVAAELGIRRFIVEKPLAHSIAELQKIRSLKDEYDLEIFVVSNWTASNLTTAIENHVHSKEARIDRINIQHHKSRISLSLSGNSSHQSVFDVEFPHMLGLATIISGSEVSVTSATSWDLSVDNLSIQNMGGGSIELECINGSTTSISSNHMSPIRKRYAEVIFSDGTRIEGFYPCSSNDFYSQLYEYDSHNRLVAKSFFEDDTLTQFLTLSYRSFAGLGAGPRSDFQFNEVVCALLNTAKEMCVDARLNNQPTLRKSVEY